MYRTNKGSTDPKSRYANTPNATFMEGKRTITWRLPRILPLLEDVPMTGRSVTPRPGERLDQLTARLLGDSLSAWQITDGNASLDPLTFVDEHAHGVDVPTPRVPR